MADQPQNATTNQRSVNERPFWLPDTQGFLAVAIIVIVALLAWLLLTRELKFDDKVAGAFMTLLGVLTACLKDVYSFFFGSSRGSDKKDDVISAIAAAPPPAPTVPPKVITAWWSVLTDAERAALSASPDPRVQAFVAAAAAGRAAADDLAYLVNAGLLTQDRAAALQSA
jgi:hypothetical protein